MSLKDVNLLTWLTYWSFWPWHMLECFLPYFPCLSKHRTNKNNRFQMFAAFQVFSSRCHKLNFAIFLIILWCFHDVIFYKTPPHPTSLLLLNCLLVCNIQLAEFLFYRLQKAIAISAAVLLIIILISIFQTVIGNLFELCYVYVF